MADIFISYAGEDRAWVEEFAQALAEQGWSVWWDRSIPFGQSYQTVIAQALEEAKCVFVIWSSNSVTSSWVLAEAEDARNRNILIPVVIDQSRPPLVFRQIQTADLSQWQSELLMPLDPKLLRDIGSLIGENAQPSASPVDSTYQGDGDTRDAWQGSNDSSRAQIQQPVRHAKAVYLSAFVVLLLAALAVFLFLKNGKTDLPKIHQFTAEPITITAGELTTLSWHTENASKVELQGFAELSLSGSKTIKPSETSIYTLIITDNRGRTLQREIEVVVTPAKTDDSEEKVAQLLALASQSIKAHEFKQAKQLLKEAWQISPEHPGFHQTQEYYEQTKKLYDQSLAIEEKLQALKQAEQKSKAASTVKTKDQAAETYRQQLEEKRLKEAYQLQQQELERIKAEEDLIASQRKQALADAEAERLKLEQAEQLRAREEQLEKREKIKKVLDSIHR